LDIKSGISTANHGPSCNRHRTNQNMHCNYENEAAETPTSMHFSA